MRYRILAASLVAASLSGATSFGQRAPRDVSGQLEALLRQHDVPGMVAIVARESEIVVSGAAGVRERDKPEKITLRDKFHLGSETKAMTSTLCAILVEQGELRWDMTLDEAFPKLREAILPAYHQVTLEQLLTQRTGFRTHVLADPHIRELLTSSQNDFPGPPAEARRACVKYVLTQPPENPPGERFIYSNANYVVAGHVLETLLNEPWEELIRRKLFQPLDMTSAGFGPPGRADVRDQPRGHTSDGRVVLSSAADADNPQFYGPSGRVHASALDWARFAAFHATQGASEPGLLREESFAKLHAPRKSPEGESELDNVAAGSSGYAMGWIVFPTGVLAHSGTNLRWFAQMAVVPQHRLSVLVACNQGGDEAEKCCVQAIQNLVKDYFASSGQPEAAN